MTKKEPLPAEKLDPDLVVWGTARDGKVTATGFGQDGLQDAVSQGFARGLDPIVHYHPDLGWV